MDQRPPKRKWAPGSPAGPPATPDYSPPVTPTKDDQIRALTKERNDARLELAFLRQEMGRLERRMGLQEESLTRLYEQLTEARDVMIHDRSYGRICFQSEPPSSPQE